MRYTLEKYIYYLLLTLLLFSSSCNYPDDTIYIPSGSFHYRSYNSDGKKVVEGWFTMEEDSTGYISGEWHFDIIGSPKDIGPQVGDGVLVGGFNGDKLWIELNPQYRDNNLQLVGALENGSYNGVWIWISLPGVTGEGTFKSDYKE